MRHITRDVHIIRGNRVESRREPERYEDAALKSNPASDAAAVLAALNMLLEQLQPFATCEEVGNMLRLSKWTISARIRAGEIKAVRYGRGWRIPRKEVQRLLAGEPLEVERGAAE
jgi:excisionase family DNA binding protein